MDSGTYYCLRGLAAAIWTQHEHGATDARLFKELEARYGALSPDQAARVRTVLEVLREDQLVVEEEDGAPESGNPGASYPERFEPPEIHRFTDMRDLLLLDPVHDVDDRGWPMVIEEPDDRT